MIRPTTFNGFQEMFKVIYGDYNDRNYSNEALMMRLFEITADCFESLRKGRIKEIAKKLPQMFAWLCSFCNRHKVNAPEVIWFKYPNVCPYGLEEQGCYCIVRETKYDPTLHELLRFRNDRTRMPSTINGFGAMIGRIYYPINKVQPLSALLDHVIEEVGEISKDFRLGNQAGVDAEVADAFAWLFSTANHLPDDLEKPYDFEEKIWKEYPGCCDVCYEEKCACPEPAIRGF